MKKLLLPILLFILYPPCLNAQNANNTYGVSTEPSKRGALLEEFTGIHCGYCPQGHAVAKKMMRNHDNVYTIAIHSGHYAVNNRDEPDFRIDEGEQLDNYYAPGSYPSGMVNRSSAFTDSNSPVSSRSLWPYQAKDIISQDASVNLLATATFDGSNRKMSIHVEGYFTVDDQPQDQELMVVWTQSNILGPQSGANMGDDYSHQNMLRQYVTPLWGDTLQAPTKGQYFTRDYEIDVPADIKKVEVVPADIRVLAFVCQGKGEVLNVTSCKPQYNNYSIINGEIEQPQIPIGNRYAFNFFELYLKNNSTEAVTTATFDITINDVKKTVEWSGEIASGCGADIRLPITDFTLDKKDENDYLVELTTLNGKSVKKSKIKGDFIWARSCTPDIDLTIKTNYQSDVAVYSLKDEDGNIVKLFGPYPVGEITEDSQTLSLEPNKMYCFEVWSPWGVDLTDPNSTFVMHNDDGSLLVQTLKITDYGTRTFLYTSMPTCIKDINTYTTEVQEEFYDLTGRRVTNPVRGIYIHNGKKTFIK